MDDIFVFKEEKSDFKETENQIVQSIVSDKKFPLQKTEIDYIESKSQTVIEIEDETDQDKKGYLLTAIDFNKVNLTKA